MRLRKDISLYVFRKLNREYDGYFMTKSCKSYCVNSIDVGYAIYRDYKTFYI